ncbi:N-terminal acetyltransferase A complex auxiliary subunit NAA15 [Lachnellula suecica]|uniref:N-terminal acetyltransferase A complex auxiliary subunit NAA15 n=1 Tax=Lachnellula suecica TaxID=602035 RepID=A0A8T9BSI2_9HELO|nr:N-terminal acetyltransferase A complex auxiliary subunit NAA15 [Lachnellula suecica]
MPQALSAKEQSLFRTVVRNYEDKQYKKGIKAADQILKKNPKHGDTLAMKALIMNSQGKTEEAFALAKVALQCDMKSHVCWHVYGLLWRAVKNFEEAIKAYKFALRLEPDSAQIQRDLALLQVQMRDYQGYLTSRKSMLQSKSHVRQSWTALAVAHHLNGELAEAEGVLTTYEETLKNPPSRTDFENSEALMYKNSIIAEQGDYQKALDHLESACKHTLDRLAVLEARATYLTKLGKKEEATKAYRALIERNSELKKYYDGLIEAMGIDAADHEAMKAVYDEYAEKYPRNDAARRLPLDFLESDDFRETADLYIHRMLDKGVPSTFANLKHLYSSPLKRETLPALVQKYIDSGKSEANEEPKRNGDTSKGASAAYYFLAQHYNYYLSRDLDKAMEFIEKAIELEPKSVDFHMTKARIWKHYGDTNKASEIMEQARALDTRDRHINTKAAKYKLRNNETDDALKTMGMFTRAETVGGPLADLHDMQCVWFLTEDGQSYARQGNIGLALKRFTSIYNIFDVWQEDQFDFHSFSLRKGQMRAYVEMIRWEDQLREHPFYTRAALSAINVYLKMHDKPSNTNGTAEGEEDAAERKKAAKKARKEAQKAEREALAKKNEPNKATKEGDNDPKKKDDDPDGSKLAATTEPVNDAMKFLTPLLQFSPKSIDAQIAGFEVYIRRRKYLLALRCLLAASALDKDNSKVHSQTIRFKLALDRDLASLDPKAAAVIKSEFTLIPSGTSLTQFNNAYLSAHKDWARRTLASLSSRKLLADSLAPSADADVVAVLKLDSVTLEEAAEGLELLKSWKSGEIEAFRKAAAAKWPKATVFAATS